MANRRRIPSKTILAAKAATGFGTKVNVSDFKYIELQYSTDSSANLTFKIQGSLTQSESNIDFTAAASTANHWDYVASYDLNDPSSIVTGDTGYARAGTDTVQNLIVNVDALEWINAEVTARSAGNVTLKVVAFDNA